MATKSKGANKGTKGKAKKQAERTKASMPVPLVIREGHRLLIDGAQTRVVLETNFDLPHNATYLNAWGSPPGTYRAKEFAWYDHFEMCLERAMWGAGLPKKRPAERRTREVPEVPLVCTAMQDGSFRVEAGDDFMLIGDKTKDAAVEAWLIGLVMRRVKEWIVAPPARQAEKGKKRPRAAKPTKGGNNKGTKARRHGGTEAQRAKRRSTRCGARRS